MNEVGATFLYGIGEKRALLVAVEMQVRIVASHRCIETECPLNPTEGFLNEIRDSSS